MSAWKKAADNPIIRPEPGTWKHDRCTSVSVAFKDGKCYFYHDGGIGSWWRNEPGFNWVGVLTCPAEKFDGKTFTPFVCNPILTHGRFNDVDRLGMISVRIRIIEGKFYLYYCAMSYEGDFVPGKCPMWRKEICCAVSDDGFNFTKIPKPVCRNPEGMAAGCPSPFFWEEKWRMVSCAGPIDRSSPIVVQLQVSDDPLWFDQHPETVFRPGQPGEWDSNSLGAATVYHDPDDGYFYMLYGGTRTNWDYPEGMGLARSRDLRHWERYPHNPIITRGEPGEFDDGAMWPMELVKHNGVYYAWYEGRSAGRDRSVEYSPNATKQIGLMTCEGKLWA